MQYLRGFLLYFIIIILTSCLDQVSHVGRIGPDRDIVLVNIENGDRAFIAKILSKVDSIKPNVVGIDVYFREPGEARGDSLLAEALKRLKGDILSFGSSAAGIEQRSIPKFTSVVEGEGFLQFENTNGLVTKRTPVKKMNGRVHESFALKIVKHWKPNFNISFPENKSVFIEYTRTLNSFLTIWGSDLIDMPISDFDLNNLRQKIFLVGYIGPKEEDRYKTPLRYLANSLDQGKPDTYGLVIIANQIRTLLDQDAN